MPSTAKHNWLLYFFGCALVTDLVAAQMNFPVIRIFSKPALMLVLAVFVISQQFNARLKILLLLALIFSLAGDVFLLFDNRNSLFFIFGLLSFLLAHVFYICLFIALKRKFYPSSKWKSLIVLALMIYVGALFYLLYPTLGDLKIPVIIYALVLSAMFITAAQLHSTERPNWLLIAGAFLFVVSDSLLAINKFFQPFSGASLLVMITYGLAQLLIVTAVLKLIRSADKRYI